MNRKLVAIAIFAVGCSTTRQLRDPTSLPVTGKAERTRGDDALDYSIAAKINAPAEVVWGLLTDAPQYTSWNTTIVKLEGKVALDQSIQLVAKVAPERTFGLKVTTFEAPQRMVWEDGNGMFLGVRTFTLRKDGDGVIFTMSETFSGAMLGMIEDSLPDFTGDFDTFTNDLKVKAEAMYASTSPAAVAPVDPPAAATPAPTPPG